MGLGGTTSNRKIYYCEIKSKRDGKIDPHFRITVRNGNDYEELSSEYAISGWAHRIYDKENKNEEGKIFKNVVLVLVDNDEEFHISGNIGTFTGRALANTVLTITEPGYMELKIRAKDDKAQLGIFNNNSKIDWKYDWEQQKEYIEYKPDPQNEEKSVGVYRALNEKLLTDWKEITPTFNRLCKNNPINNSVQSNQNQTFNNDFESKEKKPQPENNKKSSQQTPLPEKEPDWLPKNMDPDLEDDDLPF